MAHLNVNLDEKAVKAVGLGKAVARGEGDRRLDTVHVFKAALLAFPEEVALHVRDAGGAWCGALWDFVTPPEGFGAESDHMPVTKELAALVRRLGRNGEVVTLEALLNVVLRNPSVRVRSLLNKAGGTDRASGRRCNTGGARPRLYASRRDWLADLRTEWVLRRSAARACGYSSAFEDDDYRKPCSAENVLDTAARVAVVNRSKAESSPVKYDPLAPLASDLDEVQRGVCEGVLVDQLYGLSGHPLGGLSVRALAQMLSPEAYPGNAGKVLDAVERLETMGVVARCEHDDPARLTGRVRLADDVLGQLLAHLGNDAISAGELSEMKRRLRHGDG